MRYFLIHIFLNFDTESLYATFKNTFGGGVWWSKDRGANKYKNAITNGLFLTLAIKLAHEYPDEPKYLTWAEKSWTWYKNSGMINDDYLINDGLTSTGVNNGGITWTYNQGMAICGTVGLYKETGKAEYLTEAQKLANAAIIHLADTNANVLQDHCEWKNNCVPNPNSGHFKGIYMRCLAELTGVTFDPELRIKYKKFILDSADSAWETTVRQTINSAICGPGLITLRILCFKAQP
jgi:predicted alpha-1,6-mannanase (GH76 family)